MNEYTYEEIPVETKKGFFSDAPSFSSVFSAFVKNWKWVAVSVIGFVGISAFYVLSTPPTYTRTAAVAIKQDQDGNSVGGNEALSAFSSMGFISQNTNLPNEMAVLQSPDLMENVVRQLGLEMDYKKNGVLRNTVLYGSTLPLKVTFKNLSDAQSASMRLRISDGRIQLSDFRTPLGDKIDFNYEGAFKSGMTIGTPVGPVTVETARIFDPEEDYDIFVSKSSILGAAKGFASSLTLDHQLDGGSIVEMTVNDQNKERADDILNALIDCYNRAWIADKNAVAISTTNFINDRLSVIESELGNVDSDISSFKSQHLVPDVEQAAGMYMRENQSTSQEIMDLTNQLQMTRYLRDHILRDSRADRVIPANTGINNLNIETQIGEYNKLVLQRNSLAGSGSDAHPIIADLDGKITSMRSAIMASIDNQISSLSHTIKTLQGAQGELSSQLASSPTQARYLLSVERQQKVKENLYLFLLQKREENELSQAYTSSNTRMVRRPGGLDSPTSPQRMKILLVGFLMGLLVPFAIIYVRMANDKKIHERKDIDGVAAPVIGEVPMVERRRHNPVRRFFKRLYYRLTGQKQRLQASQFSSHMARHQFDAKNQELAAKGFEHIGVVVHPGDRDIINESFRVLRTNLRFLSGHSRGQAESADTHEVIAVTSFNPGSGKTFITMNLAVTMALKGNKVLIIDGDLRRASASAYIGSPREGISDYLAGPSDDISKYIIHAPAGFPESLDMIPVGNLPPNPTELLENGKFTALMERLKQEYSYILIDCPPAEMMADARIINTVCTRTIFVLRCGLLDRSYLQQLDQLYEQKAYHNISVVLNGTKAESNGYGYFTSYNYR